MSWPLSVLYGAPHEPFWGAPSSHMNFCEEDYIVTTYIAEFFNTLTNLTYRMFIDALDSPGIIRAKRNNSIFDIATIPYWGLIGVGVASAAYHTVLNYHVSTLS
ncbi:hypothetical protein LTR09_006781 [Extremus antarcticus]|uniref:Alkaline ceramidase n=1 Tax=Extremus antarcticus TaxID=702011 RepID=A0AAJ0DLI8_9PEZI|nr:hypothetical protein LTR09_006781 [Extremus antarcticus]